jgi:Family of unknown function (DUF6502)
VPANDLVCDNNNDKTRIGRRDNTLDNELKQAAFSSFSILMRPVVRILLRCGVTWKELAELVKLLYVDVATEDYGKHGRPANASRVAILTGLSRRDVKRVRDALEAGGAAPAESLAQINHASRVLSGWFQDPDFRDAQGRPKLLARAGERGFAGLAKRYAPDIPSTAMLKELKAAGAVTTSAGGRLRAKMRYYAPAAPDETAVLRAGSVLEDVGNTVADNLFGGELQSRFEGRATNVHVPRAARRAFREFIEARGMAFLEEVDRWLSEHEIKPSQDGKTTRLGIGVYLIQDD